MDKRAAIWHIGIALVIGGVVSSFTDLHWLAASFWVSAAMFLNGSVAFYEDGLPGGFDNPDGGKNHEFVRGKKLVVYAAQSIAVTLVLISIGLIIEKYL